MIITLMAQFIGAAAEEGAAGWLARYGAPIAATAAGEALEHAGEELWHELREVIDKVEDEALYRVKRLRGQAEMLATNTGQRVTDYYKRKKAHIYSAPLAIEASPVTPAPVAPQIDMVDGPSTDYGGQPRFNKTSRFSRSFNKMGRRRYNKKRGRRGRRRRSSKKVTRVGVKRMIANYIPSQQTEWAQQTSGHCYGAYGKKGVNVIPMICAGSWIGPPIVPTDLNLMYQTAKIAFTQDWEQFTVKNYHRKFYFRNPTTEGETVTAWLCKYIADDAIMGSSFTIPPYKNLTIPLVVSSTWQTQTPTVSLSATWGPLWTWQQEYKELLSATYNTLDFYSNMADNPTKYQTFNDRYKIVKKVQFGLQPGQTKRWDINLPAFKWEPTDHNSPLANVNIDSTTEMAYCKQLTHFIMLSVQGVPTHYNDGAGTNNPGTINLSATGVEWWSRATASVGVSPMNSQKRNYITAADTDAIISARSLIPENEGAIRTV